MKYFRMSYDEVVFKRSYLNLILLNRAIPGYKPIEQEKTEKKGRCMETEDADDTPTENGGSRHANDFFMKFM